MALIDNVISNWNCDEASGTIEDTAGSNNGTNSGAVYGATGKLGDSLDFESSDNDYVDCGTSSTLNFDFDGTFSAVMWVNAESLQTNMNPISKINGDGGFEGWQMRTHGAGTISLTITTVVTSNQLVAITDGNELGTGTLTLIGFTYDNKVTKFYVNGSLKASSTPVNTLSSSPPTGAPFNIGNKDNGILSNKGFDGIIGNVTTWSSALSNAEHLELWNSGDGLAYPFSAATTRKIKIGGTFQDKPIKKKIAGTFQDKPRKIKVGGTFQDA